MSKTSHQPSPAGNGASRTWSAIIMLTVVTLLTFSNSWPDSLVFDDKTFVGPDPTIQLESLSQAFTDDIWRIESSALGLYRPLLQIYFEMQNRLFGEWLPGYHLVNIFLHLAATLLLFGFLRFLFKRSGNPPKDLDLVALMPALVFAVHPAHTEVLNSVFNGSSIIVSILSISGLWWLLSRLEYRPVTAWAGMGFCFVLAILFKDSALVLPGIAVAMVILLTEGSFLTRVRRMMPVFWLLVPIVIYFLARGYALAPEEADAGSGGTISSGIRAMYDAFTTTVDRHWQIKLSLFGKGMKVLAWPYPLQLYYSRPAGSAALFFILLQVVLLAWAILRLWRGKPIMAAGLAFYYIALTPSIRVISLDGAIPHLSERYLYVPSIGLAIVLGVAFRFLFGQFGKKKVILFSLPILVLLSALCWERNSEWASELNLFETEYAQGHRGANTLRLLISAHHAQGNTQRVVQICDKNPEAFKASVKLANTCAISYISTKRQDDAIAALEVAAAQPDLWIGARVSLAAIYVAKRELQKAADLYAEIVNRVEKPEEKEIYKGDLYLAVYKKNPETMLVARQHYQNALKIRPGWKPAKKRLTALDRLLAEMEEATGQESPPADPRTGPE